MLRDRNRRQKNFDITLDTWTNKKQNRQQVRIDLGTYDGAAVNNNNERQVCIDLDTGEIEPC